MIRKTVIVAGLSGCLLAACSANDEAKDANEIADVAAIPEFHVAGRIEAPPGGYDYISVDAPANRLFVGREYGVMTVDLATGKVRTLLERDDVAAVLPLPGTNLLLSTNNGSDTATILDRTTGDVIADIPTGKAPDGAMFDKTSGLVFVMNGDSEDITLIDPKTGRNVGTIPVDGKPEAAVADGTGRVYLNLEDTNELVTIDVAARQVAGRRVMQGCEAPTGIAFDPVSNLLISTCANGVAKLIEAGTGADRGGIAIGKGADGSVFDPKARLGFASCDDGTLSIYRLDNDGKLVAQTSVKTAAGARTMAYDPASGRAYLTAKAGSSEEGFEVILVGSKV